MTGEIASRRAGLPTPWTTIAFLGFWIWAIWSCAEYWQGNPNYSYGWAVPFLALGFGVRRYWRIRETSDLTRKRRPYLSEPLIILLAIGVGVLVFALEVARQEMWHPQIVLDLICLLAVVFSFHAFRLRGGPSLAHAEIFPVLFFFTAVPWPARIEQPITSTLMHGVAIATVELLHWSGVAAQTSGGAIALTTGLVGITEACSGVRSLQAGIMFGLAVGEWFLLRPIRRAILLALAVALALLTNLGRTLALALQAERHGVPSVEEVHDLIGNVAVSALIVGVWFAGKLLSARARAVPLVPVRDLLLQARQSVKGLFASGESALAPIFIASVIGFVFARGAYAAFESREHAQSSAFFHLRANTAAGQQLLPVPRQIWNELRPTSGAYIRREDPGLPRGVADLYHFFWKPSPWNRFALVHRPDICMPGIGWESTGPPEPLTVDFDNVKAHCHLFRFRRGEYHALQLWGVWRNGVPVALDYTPQQVLGAAEPPPDLPLEGKRRSATEIIACSLISEHTAPEAEMAAEILRSVFAYQPQ